jgi:hypothetical protein
MMLEGMAAAGFVEDLVIAEAGVVVIGGTAVIAVVEGAVVIAVEVADVVATVTKESGFP